ncbi:hypothetical protein VTJ83DRAFT_2765 [Remersonia thermophila]|uniref:Aromatic prenyltransferase n=1 Tax=Remersonia thermophila TaxID=72144 RepID=A0ABR4DJZ7_9PEZI
MATASPQLPPARQTAAAAGPKPTAQQFWTRWGSDILGPLMAHSGSYTPEQMAVHLKFWEQHVVPTLGPLPSEPRNTYTQTYVDSPLEPSLNLTSSGKVKVRYGIEVVKPYGCEHGEDPFGEHRAREVLPALARACGADLQWINSAMDAFFLTKEETEAMRGKLPTFMPSALLAFDMEGDKTMMKIYIIGMRKAIASGLPSTNHFILGALRKLNPLGEQLAPGLNTVAEYLSTTKHHVMLIFVGIDCVDPTVEKGARVKVYLHTSSNAFEVVRDVMTLGGRLTDESALKRVEILRDLWPLLRNEKPGEGPDPVAEPEAWEAWHKTDRLTGTPLSGLQYNVEICPNKPDLETKCYVPLFQHTSNAAESEVAMEKVLDRLGHEWGSNTSKYRHCVAAAFGPHRVSPTFVSFSYSKKKGVYMSSYLPGVLNAGSEIEAGDWEYK